MKYNILIPAFFCFLMSSCLSDGKEDHKIDTEICILGGSEAGFTAAIQAARLGKEVVLIEPTGHPGGMMVEGIVKDIRFGSARVIGGIAREVYTAIEAYYGLEPDFQDPGWYSRYEPSVAESIIEDLLAREENIEIIRRTRIKETGGVEKEENKLKSIILENGFEISAKLFIDASIEGHLIHFAGVTTETMREGNAIYGETRNGIQVDNTYRQFMEKVDPYILPGDPASGLLPTIQEGVPGEYGALDKHIQ
jgi:NADPH-dependent 2,4-dienoyl-CoA reductase/sulfur reductase-like enzyme